MLVGQIAYDRLNDKAKARVTELAAKIQRDGVPYNAVNICLLGRRHQSPRRRYAVSRVLPLVALHRYRLLHERPRCPVESSHAVQDQRQRRGRPAVLRQSDQDQAVRPRWCPTNPSRWPWPCISSATSINPSTPPARYNPNPKPPPDEYKDDAGGNGVSLANFVDTPWPPNLHTFWDEAYRRYYEAGQVKASPP
jgi:hypothetical protein